MPPTVLHVIPNLNVGGAERMLQALVGAPRKNEFRQIVVNLMGEGCPSCEPAGARVLNLGLTGIVNCPQTIFRLAGIIRNYQPVAIQSWLYYADIISLWALRLSGLRRKTRLYWGVRGSELETRLYSLPLRWTIAACARQSGQPDAVVANSIAGRAAHQRIGYRPRAFAVLPNGIDTERFKPDPDARARVRAQLGLCAEEPVVISVARVDPMKDHGTLIATIAALPEIRFILVGNGTDRLSLPSNALALGIQTDLPSLYAAADAAISTSAFGEGFSNSIAEAMATGIGIIATDAGDAHRIIGKTGTVVAARDTAAMVRAVRHFLSLPQAERQELGALARDRVRSLFSLEKAVALFDDLHLRAILPPEPTISHDRSAA